MSAITSILGADLITNSRTTINTNFSNLNTDKMETSVLDTDTTFAANSDLKVATQKAVKTYVDSVASPVGKSWNEYAASGTGSDAYAVTVAGVTAYVTGQTYKFKADVANTGTATLNVNGLGAKTIKKEVTSDLATGDLLASQIVVVVYDGTNMQIISKTSVIVTTPVVNVYTSSGTWTKPTGLKYIVVEVVGGGGNGGTGSALNPGSSGGGGGGGGYSKETIAAASLGATETYIVGAATATSSFGTSPYLQATGGSNGTNGGGDGGAGGVGSNGNINSAGQGGMAAGTFSGNYGGVGGSSVLGGGGFSGGGAGGTYGGGGGGSSHGAGNGAGASGVVIVTEFY